MGVVELRRNVDTTKRDAVVARGLAIQSALAVLTLDVDNAVNGKLLAVRSGVERLHAARVTGGQTGVAVVG